MRKLIDYEPVLLKIMQFCAKNTKFQSQPGLHEILERHPRLIVAVMHASPLSWVPSMALLALETAACGGRHRSPMGVVDNFFFHLPGLREIAHYLTQSDRPLSYHELAQQFRDNQQFDLVLFPEGSNCFFGPSDRLQEFRSPKFVELCIDTDVPILLAVHKGSENWSVTVPVPDSWIEKIDKLPPLVSGFLTQRLKKTGMLTVPILPKPMENFTLSCELYYPELKKEDLKSDPELRREQIREEAKKVHLKMTAMLEQLS